MLATGSFSRALALAFGLAALLALDLRAQEPAAPAAPPEEVTPAPPAPQPAPAPAPVAPRVPRPAPPPAAAPAAPAAPAQEPAAVAQAPEAESLLAAARERFDVYGLRDGALLLPKYAAPQVRSVQVAAGSVAINGRAASGAEIDSLLGQDAALVLRLSYLSPEALARAAGVEAAVPSGVEPAAPREPEEPAEAAGAVEPATPPEFPDFPEPSRGDVVRFGHSIEVEEGETITGDVVAIGGNVDVAGTVLGDVVSIGGILRLADTAQVMGDAVAVGGMLERAPGAQVLGESQMVDMSFPLLLQRGWMWDGSGAFSALEGLLVTLFWIALLLLIGALFVLFLDRRLDRVETNLRSSPWKAGLVGFLAQVLFLPAYVIGLVLLVVTIIGIPIAVIWAIGFFVAGFVALLFGFSAVARATGHFFSGRFDRPLHSSYIAILVGLLALFTPSLLGNLFGFGPGFMDMFSALFHVIGFLVLYVAATIGFGAVILTRFGTRTTWSGEPPVGATPPPPPHPVEPAPGLDRPVVGAAPAATTTSSGGWGAAEGPRTLAAPAEAPPALPRLPGEEDAERNAPGPPG